MSSQTPNINLTLPTGVENVSRQIINDNNTKIDTAIGTLNSKITDLTATATGSADGNVDAAIKAVRTYMKAQDINEGVFRVVVGSVSSPLVVAERWASGNRIIGTIVYSQDAMYSFRINEADETITKYQLALNNKFIVENVSVAGSSTAGSSVGDYDIDITKSGYTAIGIVGTAIYSGGALCLVSSYIRTGALARVRVRNTSSSAVTPDSISIAVLYQKN